MANAIAGVGTTFERWSGSAWQFIAEINAIEGPTMNKENIEVTALDTDGGYDEFITGFMEGGTLTLNMNFTRSGYELMKQDFEIDVARDYRITLPDDEDTTLEFEGLVIEIPLTMEAEDKLTVDVTIQVTGEVAIASAGAESYWLTREPSGIAVTITGATTATITWTDSAESGADGYKVYADATLKGTIAVGVQTAAITGLTADTTYTFKVVAYKGTNESTGVTASGTTTIVSPASIATLVYDFDFNDYASMTDDGAGVISKVVDKVAALELTAATTARPTYVANQVNGKGCLRFNGTSNTMAHTAQDIGTTFTLFQIAKAVPSGGTLMANALDDYYFSAAYAQDTVTKLNGGASNLNCFIKRNSVWNYYSFAKTGATIQFMERSIIQPIQNRASVTSGQKLILANVGRSAGFFNGDVGRIFAYNSRLDNKDIAKINKWIEVNYGLNDSDVVVNAENRIYMLGNSLLASPWWFRGGSSTIPASLLALVTANLGICEYMEQAVGGYQTSSITSTFNPTAIDLRSINPKSKNDIIIFWEGTNDLVANQNAEDAYTRIAACCTPLKTAGYKVGVCTILPRSHAGIYANFEADRQTVNTSIRNNIATIGTFVIDVGGDALMGQAGDSDNATYYFDKVHPTAAGQTRLVNEWFYPAVKANWTD